MRSNQNYKQPHQRKHKNSPIPLNKRIMEVLRRNRKAPVRLKELAVLAKVGPKERKEFDQLIAQYKAKGVIVQERNAVGLAENMKTVKAKIVSVQERFGFARPLEENATKEDDIFLPGREMLGAMPGDIVLVRLSKDNKGKTEGRVIEILEEVQESFSAVLFSDRGRFYVQPDKYVRIPIEVWERDRNGAKAGDKVLATIGKRGEGHFSHRAKILQSFGTADSAANCCEAVLANYHARLNFDAQTQAEAEKIAAKGIHPSELMERLDLTGYNIFTIDGADTKDIDDAISLEKVGDVWELGVHIADVSYYVKPGTALDNEAYARGTSIYYADQVLPMLPKELSNGICSLNPDEVRLTFSALLTINEEGDLIGYRFAKSYIRSRVKGVYKEINAILDGTADEEIQAKYQELLPEIYQMRELAAVLHKRRFERGSMNIESSESKFLIENGRVVDILPRERGESERFIEEFMLMANQAAASVAMNEELPFVYRVHDDPPLAKVSALKELLTQVGIDPSPLSDEVTAKEMSDILESVRGSRLEQLINNQLLRSMAKAVYSSDNTGHFGLVLDNYAHFTSPIRRYPDLIIHRILSAHIGGSPRKVIDKRFGNYVSSAALHCSECEQNAVNIERDCEDCYKAEYMAAHLEEVFEGVISSVQSYGFYVELPNTVEGLVHVSELPFGDYILEETMELVEQLSNTRYKIGQKVLVKAVSVDVSAGEIDFVLVDESGAQLE